MQMALETQKFSRKVKFGAQIHFGEKSLKKIFLSLSDNPMWCYWKKLEILICLL
jgi:hypothetical protein